MRGFVRARGPEKAPNPRFAAESGKSYPVAILVRPSWRGPEKGGVSRRGLHNKPRARDGETRRPESAAALTDLILQTLEKAQLISNSVPFHEREARFISPSPRILRPSESCIKLSVRHRCFPVLS